MLVVGEKNFSASQIYLMIYNLFQSLGWTAVFIQLITHLCSHGINTDGLWNETQFCLKLFQSLAFLEVLHILFGFVRSSAVTAFVQIFSRFFIVWAICNRIEEAQLSYGVPLMLLAWCFAEISRYSFYVMNILNEVPYFMKYFRYTLFIILYPMGVTGEMLCCFAALQKIKTNNIFTISLPNVWNFTFDFYYVTICIMLLYIPVFPQLYLYMFSQRRKVLGAQKQKKSE